MECSRDFFAGWPILIACLIAVLLAPEQAWSEGPTHPEAAPVLTTSGPDGEPGEGSDWCGDCWTQISYHFFYSADPVDGLFKCDNTGGCHANWYTGGCTQHAWCDHTGGGGDPGPVTEDLLAVAIETGDAQQILEALSATASRWAYDPDDSTLELYCGDKVYWRAFLPEGLSLPPTPEAAASALR